MDDQQREREREARANKLNDEIAGQGYENTPGVDGHGVEGTVLDPNMGGKPITAADVTPGATAEPYPGTADARRLREEAQHDVAAARRDAAGAAPHGGDAEGGIDIEAAAGGPQDMAGTPAPGGNAMPFRRPNERPAGKRPVQDSEGLLDIGGQTDHDVNFPVPEG